MLMVSFCLLKISVVGDLKNMDEPVSCTSRLCCWNAPMNVEVDAKPVINIVITKYRFVKKTD